MRGVGKSSTCANSTNYGTGSVAARAWPWIWRGNKLSSKINSSRQFYLMH